MTSLWSAVPRAESTAAFDRANPLARLVAALLISIPSLVWVNRTLALATIVVTLVVTVVASGISRRGLALATSWTLVAGATAGVANALGAPSSAPDRISLGIDMGLRVVAVVLPGLVAFATIDPSDAADAAVFQLHVPVRAAYGVLAAVRQAPALITDWHRQADAERARGIVGHGPIDAVRRWWRRIFGLLVAALRRAQRTAIALDSRGFDQLDRRAAAASPWRWSDTAWVAGGLATALLLVGLTV